MEWRAGSKLSVPRRWGADPNGGWTEAEAETKEEKGKRKKKKPAAPRPREEGRLSDLFPWQDDKTARNATERGKRSDQELKARGAGAVRVGG